MTLLPLVQAPVALCHLNSPRVAGREAQWFQNTLLVATASVSLYCLKCRRI